MKRKTFPNPHPLPSNFLKSIFVKSLLHHSLALDLKGITETIKWKKFSFSKRICGNSSAFAGISIRAFQYFQRV